MTATITTRPLSDGYIHGRRRRGSDDSLLRFAMRADATLCAGLGLLVAMAADPLARLSGLSAASEWIGGAALVAYGAALYVMAAAPFVRRLGAGLVVVNVGFAVVAISALAAGVLPLTGVGVAMVLATVAATLGAGVPAVPRSAPAGVTPSEPVRGRFRKRLRRRPAPAFSPITRKECHDSNIRRHRPRRPPGMPSCGSPCDSTPS